MLQVSYRKKGITISHVWFANEEEIKQKTYKDMQADLYYLHGITFAIADKGYIERQFSLIKNLQLSEEDLFLSLGKHLRQYIKRSNKENIVRINLYEGQEILNNPQIVDDCKNLFEKMFADKGTKNKFNKNLFCVYAKNDALIIGMATINNVPVGFSAVVFNNEMGRLWLAAFDFRNASHDSQVLSRGHQRLDWELLLWCNKHGVKQFDFGGVSSFDEPNGIDKFKMAFEKEGMITYYNYIIPNTFIGKATVAVKCKKMRLLK